MAKKYFRTTYSPVTYEMALKDPKDKCGIPKRYSRLSKEVNIGDVFIEYMLGISRFVGLHEIISKAKLSDENLYYENDPYVLQYDIKNLILLPLEFTIPIFEPIIWDNFSITKGLERSNKKWSGSFMGSFAKLKDADGQLLESILLQQQSNPVTYPLNKTEETKYKWHISKQPFDKNYQTSMESVDDEDDNLVVEETDEKTYYKSSEIQALLSFVGNTLGFQIWVPPHDRNTIKTLSNVPDDKFLEEMPYDISDVAKQIDVLWVNGRSIIRAFEVEGTTSVFSGILRMSDLVEENPNIHTSLHIVAPIERKDKVFKELSRPTFSKLQSLCSYIPYEVIEQLAKNEDLEYLKESIVDKYCEYPDYI